jgi:hypothetical protein
MYGRRRLTRIEMAVYAFIVAALLVVFARYVLEFMEMAEKAAMETTVMNVTAAINLHYAAAMVAGQPIATGTWVAANPFELARAFPPNYRGTVGEHDAAGLDRPAWLFDPLRAELVYLPRLHSHLEDGTDELRFRLERHAAGFGFVLAPTPPYRWHAAGF